MFPKLSISVLGLDICRFHEDINDSDDADNKVSQLWNMIDSCSNLCIKSLIQRVTLYFQSDLKVEEPSFTKVDQSKTFSVKGRPS